MGISKGIRERLIRAGLSPMDCQLPIISPNILRMA